ncbi:hypothetical protein [Streptosporangium sp. NPDC051022]|uniref:hypothetical protein n=1 Tax=Streptosporangium sp. NPDC051022 TaxID=3155752 RepID=UPI003443DC92
MLRHSFRALGGVGLVAALLVAGFGIGRATDLAGDQGPVGSSQSGVGVYAYGYPSGSHPDGCDQPKCAGA